MKQEAHRKALRAAALAARAKVKNAERVSRYIIQYMFDHDREPRLTSSETELVQRLESGDQYTQRL